MTCACRLTAWEDHPEEVHEEVVTPEVQKFRATVDDILVVEIECVSGIVQDEAVDLAHADNDLERVAERVRGRYHCCNYEAERAPCELFPKPRVSISAEMWI